MKPRYFSILSTTPLVTRTVSSLEFRDQTESGAHYLSLNYDFTLLKRYIYFKLYTMSVYTTSSVKLLHPTICVLSLSNEAQRLGWRQLTIDLKNDRSTFLLGAVACGQTRESNSS